MKQATLFIVLLAAAFIHTAGAQTRYNFAAQKKLIPAELGKVYLGMPFAAFAAKIDLKLAEADARYGPVEIVVPFVKGNITSVRFKVQGVSSDDAAKAMRPEKVTRKGEFGDFEEEISRIDPAIATKGAFVYEIAVVYKKAFDLRAHALKIYGPAKDAYKKGDSSHIYDLQWTKKTADGLTWLIRYHEETRTLQLCGLIKGTEWSVDVN